MTNEEIAEILAKPYAQQLLNGPEPARMAYDGLDGNPRVIPIGFWTEGDRVVMATLPKSAKVAALRKNPNVALTIDQGTFPPKVLLIGPGAYMFGGDTATKSGCRTRNFSPFAM